MSFREKHIRRERKCIMKSRYYHTVRTVRYLACAFGITLAALITLAGIHVYREHAEREKCAVLMAGEILSLRDSRKSGDGREEMFRALIDVRSTGLLREAEQHALRIALASEDLDPLAGDIETAFLENRFTADVFKESLRRFYSAYTAVNFPTAANDDAAQKTPYRETGAVRLAGDFFGCSALFRESRTAAGNAAFCRNAYAVFDRQNGRMTEFAVACVPGESVLNTDECRMKAAAYLRDRLDLFPTGVLAENSSGGICYLQMRCRGGTSVLVGVREDSGSICLFVRGWENSSAG